MHLSAGRRYVLALVNPIANVTTIEKPRAKRHRR